MAITAAVLSGGAPPLAAGMVALTVVSPLPVLAVCMPASLLWLWWRRRHIVVSRPDEVVFYSAIASELRAGLSLRLALAAAADRAKDSDLQRLARAAVGGSSVGRVAIALQGAMPRNGRHAARAFQIAADTGAGAAAVFTRLATRAAREKEVRRERRMLTAQARLSALVVGAMPLLAVAVMFLSGRGSALLDGTPVGTAITVVGLGLVGGGLTVVVWMLRAAGK
jgi:Flp pilus assembly protein TadB